MSEKPQHRRKRTGLLFFAVGALLAWGFVTHGVAAVWSVPLAGAALIATLTVGIQLLILFDYRNYGRKIGAALLALYFVFTLLNIVLAAAGVSASLLKDQLGRTSIVRQLSVAQTQIKSVADALSGVSAEAQRAADASARQQQLEAESGGSCTLPGEAPSPAGIGPIARTRDSDRALFAALAADASRLAAEMRTANLSVEKALGSYSADRHSEAIAAVRAALDRARTNAAASQAIKERAATRLTQWRAGQPVACHDPELEAQIEALATAAYPQVTDVGELPSAPSPNSAAHGLVGDSSSWLLKGTPFDLSMWAVPLVGGVLPDVLLILGFSMWSHDRRRDTLIVHDITAAALGAATDWTEFMHAAGAGLVEEGLAGLGRYHSRKSSRLGDTDVLMIPADAADARPFLMMAKALVKKGWARYQGMAKASALPPSMMPRPGIPADALCHFFVFGHGVWNRILMEAVRMAVGRREAMA